MIKYREFKEMKQNEFNNLPCMFAFSKKQLEEQIKKYNADTKELLNLGNGMFIKKTDLHLLDEWENKYTKLEKELMKNDEYVLDAFVYELGNHEYIITYDIEDTLDVFDLKIDDLKKDTRLLKIMNEAIKIIKVVELIENED